MHPWYGLEALWEKLAPPPYRVMQVKLNFTLGVLDGRKLCLKYALASVGKKSGRYQGILQNEQVPGHTLAKLQISDQEWKYQTHQVYGLKTVPAYFEFLSVVVTTNYAVVITTLVFARPF